MAKDRVAQVQELMKEELSKILFREVEMPEGAVTTLTRVDASPNLQQAKVYISVVPDEKGKEVLKNLKNNIYDIQQELNERLVMRPVPKIKWLLETATAEAQHIEELLDKIKKER
jgi:ribosome-binding factor A